MFSTPRTFQIDHAGRRYSGSFRLVGSDICVDSAYGDRRQHVSKSTDLEKLAKLLLRQIVEEAAS